MHLWGSWIVVGEVLAELATRLFGVSLLLILLTFKSLFSSGGKRELLEVYDFKLPNIGKDLLAATHGE